MLGVLSMYIIRANLVGFHVLNFYAETVFVSEEGQISSHDD